MKQLLTITFFAISSHCLFAQSDHIEQSTPFENVLLALKTDSVDLFVDSFSDRIIDGENDELVWISRLNEVKEKFKERFGSYERSDFSYDYEEEKSKLIIYYKSEEQIGLRVIKEGGVWKLDDK